MRTFFGIMPDQEKPLRFFLAPCSTGEALAIYFGIMLPGIGYNQICYTVTMLFCLFTALPAEQAKFLCCQ